MTKKEYAAKVLAMIQHSLFTEEVNIENVAHVFDYGEEAAADDTPELTEKIFTVAHKLFEAQNMLDDITSELKKETK